MNNNNTVTCSFTMNRDTYNAYKSVISKNGENVKGNIIKYMNQVISYETPNADTILAIEEVEIMKNDPTLGKTYNNVHEMMTDLFNA